MRSLTHLGALSPRFGVVLLFLTLAGCSPQSPLEANGITLAPGSDWKAASPTTWAVPGTPLAAWSGPSGSSLVAYLALPAPGVGAKGLGTALATRLENLPDLRLITNEVETIDGLDAARVVVVAPGTGAELAPTGRGKPLLSNGETPKPTRRVTILIPRQRNTVELLWHAPEESSAWLDGAIETTLKSLKITRETLSTSSY